MSPLWPFFGGRFEILALLFLGGWYVFTTAGPRAVACFAVGAALNLVSVARSGVAP